MTVDEMEKHLDRLGIAYVSDRGDEVQGYCPAHEDRTGHKDKNPSWYINADTGAHICFSCGFKGNLISLAQYVRDVTYDEAKEWLSVGGPLSEAFEKAVAPKQETFEELEYISEASLAAFTDPPPGVLGVRGITTSTSKEYGLLWDSRSKSFIIPVRRISDGKLLGWQEKGSDTRFFRNRPSGMAKSQSLFGLQQFKGGRMIIVESPLDVLRLASVGIPGGVAVYGASMSKEQLRPLYKADRVVYAFDNDSAGNRMSAFRALEDNLKGYNSWVFNYDSIDAKDVGGMTRDEIVKGLETAIHSVRVSPIGSIVW